MTKRRCANRRSCQLCIQRGPVTIAISFVVKAPKRGRAEKIGAHFSIRPSWMIESPSMKTTRSSFSTP